jgi:hypothetical protein
MSTIINYEEPYMNTLYHYLAEIYFISNKDDLNKEKKIKDYIDKIKANYNGKADISKINELIKLIEDNDLTQFKKNLKDIIK